MKRNQPSWLHAALVLAVVLAAVIVAAPITALAKIGAVTGTDYWYPIASGGESGDSIDILTVEGSQGDVLYVNVKQDDHLIANKLAYPLEPGPDGANEDGTFIGVVSVKLANGINPAEHTYTIQAYEDYEEKNLLYEGEVSLFKAQFGEDEGSDQELLALRTLADGETREFKAPTTLEYNDVSWKLSSDTPTSDNVYVYTEGAIADSIEGSVTYYDVDDNTVLRKDTFTLQKNAEQDITVDPIISNEDGTKFYRTMQLTNSVHAAYPGTTDFSIMCKEIQGDWGEGTPYTTQIRYVSAGSELTTDDDDQLLNNLIDQLIVTRTTTYTPPAYIYIKSGDSVKQYKLKADQSALADGALVLNLGDKTESVDIEYEEMDATSEAVWSIRLVNGTTGATMGTTTVKLDAEGAVSSAEGANADAVSSDGTFTAPESLDGLNLAFMATTEGTVEGGTYQLTRSENALIRHLDVYYADGAAEEVKGYTLTINYVNVANNKVVRSESREITPDWIAQRRYESYTTPERFTEGSNTYVRLNGQSDTINHHFYGSRTYTVYYRNINDNLNDQTVITRIRTIYDGTTVTTTTGGTTTTISGSTSSSTTSGSSSSRNSSSSTVSGTTSTGTSTRTTSSTIPSQSDNSNGNATSTNATPVSGTKLDDNGGLTAVTNNSNGTTSLVRDDGTDVTTERISEDSNPLAAPTSEGTKTDETIPESTTSDDAVADERAEKTGISPAMLGGIAAAAAAIAAAVFLLVSQKMKETAGEAAGAAASEAAGAAGDAASGATNATEGEATNADE